ncbi:MAG: glycosyltransferase [Bacteroidales bacterium]|nr:glycosyltransferase [Bacteroidales bacterium]
MKVCHITSAHSWDDVRIFRKECTSLAQNGFEVYLLAYEADEGRRNGVHVVSAGKRPLSRFSRMYSGVNHIVRLALELDVDIYHIHDPELLRKSSVFIKKGKKLIYDAHEDLPEQIKSKHWIPLYIRNSISYFVQFFLNFTISRISATVSATPIIQQKLKKINPNAINVSNFPLLEELDFVEQDLVKKNAFCYVGGLFITRGLIEMLDAIRHVDSKLCLAGKFSPESLETEAKNHKSWNKVEYLGFINRKEVYELMSSSIAGLVILHPTQSYRDSLPIKMFEYMSAGIPVICSDFELWKSIVEQEKCGICVNPMNTDEIAAAMNFIKNNPDKAILMGKNGKDSILKKYNWNIESKKMIALYHSLSN